MDSPERVSPAEWALLDAAQRGDAVAVEQLVAPYGGELHAHCYRMLGSVQDAEGALQEALLGAWRGIAGFAGRSAVRSWLYRSTTNACLNLIGRRPPRLRAIDYRRATGDVYDLGRPLTEVAWLEPYPEHLLGGSTPPTDCWRVWSWHSSPRCKPSRRRSAPC